MIGLLVALALLLAGCVNVPTSGPIDKVEGQEPTCQNCVNVEVAPPAAGDEPGQIVEGYLRATSNYQPNYSVARQFLSKSAAATWSPDAGATIYRGSPTADGSTVALVGTLVGFLAKDRTYTARDQDLKINFGVVRENGEWRISKPPPGLMVAEYSFLSFYQAYELYFIGNGRALVPDPIYLPKLRNPSQVSSALVKALLTGPSKWLAPVVTTSLPPGTTLTGDSVTINNGIADVPLSGDAVLALSDGDRTLLAAQVVYTLEQVVGIKGVRFFANQQPFRVPGSDPATQAVAINAVSPDLDPIPFVAAEQLYAVPKSNSVLQISANADQSTATKVPGALGQGLYDVDSLAVSISNTDLAVVTDDRTVLRRAPTSAPTSASGQTSVLLSGVSDLLRPQFTRFGEVWAVEGRAGEQRMWVFGEEQVEVDASTITTGGSIKAFKISPDGSRMAIIRRTGNTTQLGLARINRAEVKKVTVDGWRALNTAQSNLTQVTKMADVAWLDATHLLVLGAVTADASLGPVEINQDASQITAQGQANQWDAVEVTVLLRTQTALVVGRGGQTYKDDGNQWQPFLDNIKTLAYPG
ncbi:MAG TPA: LpqB family beta-propeller domain-containing protein [Propionibacteriaceae bacterium]